ncbi:JmjC domain-containing protein [Kitasatospora sp. NPDC056783]|uniref:JmjC domain-containing protein n=1 Tax=Kitasatospora sp. NPDC056783 TaxID=3345943 RepID=UPI0036A33F72
MHIALSADAFTAMTDVEPDAVQLGRSWGTASHAFAPSPDLLGLVAPQHIDDWLDCSLLRHPFFAVSLKGSPVPAHETTSPRTVAGQTQVGYIDGAKVRTMIHAGASLKINNLEEWHAPAQRFCRRLSTALSAHVRAVVFTTPADHWGLDVHRDNAHVFVVQVAGTKEWHLYDVPKDDNAWRDGVAQDLNGPGERFVLKPGQALYMPPGQAHRARALKEESVHVSLAVREPRVHETIALVVRQYLAGIPEHRSLSGDQAQRALQVRAALDATADRLRDLDSYEVLKAVERAGYGNR